jgi:hypothetical protein
MNAPAESRQIPWLVYVADRLASESGGFRADLADRGIPRDALDALGLSGDALESVRSHLTVALDEATATLAA